MSCLFCGSDSKEVAKGLCRRCYNKAWWGSHPGSFSKYYSTKSNTEKHRVYRDTEKGRVATRRAVRRYELKNREKRSAWIKAKKFPVGSCVVCGAFPAHKHHPDYSKPTEFIYLCPLHHKQYHANNV